jgi:V8-like Glu-specific endopeptidase
MTTDRRAFQRYSTAFIVVLTVLNCSFEARSESTLGTIDDEAATPPQQSERRRQSPDEPDRTVRSEEGALRRAHRPPATNLIDKFRTETVTPGGKPEVIELSPDVQKRLHNFFSGQANPGKPVGPTPSVVQPPNSDDKGAVVRHPNTPSRAIFGRDTRERVNNTTAYPFRTVGYLEGGCSGVLIGPRHVLTAGHCIFDIQNNQWKGVTRFWPGQNGEYSPYDPVQVVRLLSVVGWTQYHDREFDIGMAILSQNVGSRLGWLGYGYEDAMPNYNINLLGYPGDKPRWTMWHSYCPLEKIGEQQLFYKCAQWPGNSGGPVFVFLPSANTNTVYGVAAYGFLKYFPADADISLANEATRIDRIKYEAIRGWREGY